MVLGMIGAFGDANFGDYAMLVNNIYTIRPDETIVFTYNETLMENLLKTYLKAHAVSAVIIKTAYTYEAVYGDNYNVQYDDGVLVPMQILRYISNEKQVREAVRKIDVLFVCGGGYFNRVWNANHRKGKLLSVLGPILIASEEHKKIVFGGNTFGPFDESSEFFQSILLPLRNVVYAVRDDVYSAANLRRLGIGEKITLLPDDLYFLHEDFLFLKPEIKMALPERYIILELYCSLDEIKKNRVHIKSFVDSISQKYGLKTVFVALDKEYGGERQGQELEGLPNCMVWQFGNEPYRKVEDILHIVRRAKLVLCQRYHMFLFAIASNIPAYQILKDVCGDKRYYYAKSSGMLRQVFRNQVYTDGLFLVPDIVEGLHEIIVHYEEIICEQQRLFTHDKVKAERHMKQVRMDYIQEHLN